MTLSQQEQRRDVRPLISPLCGTTCPGGNLVERSPKWSDLSATKEYFASAKKKKKNQQQFFVFSLDKTLISLFLNEKKNIIADT